jgi:hypothetical protein
MLAAMLTTVKSLIAPLQAKQVVDSYVEYADRDLASIIVLPNYREMFSRILDREPDKV